jgi:hypothetical protein
MNLKYKFLNFSVLPAIVGMSIVSCNNTAETIKADEIAQQYNLLKDENLALQDSIKSLHALLESVIKYDDAQAANDEIYNKTNLIKVSFLQQKNLIPDSAVLGGTMRVQDIKVLNHKWVYVSYSDGHIMNDALFTYKKRNNQSYDFDLLVKLEKNP